MARKIKETHVFEDQWLEHWEVDSAADLQNLPECNPGSTVLVKDTGETVTVGDSGIPGAESGGGGGGGGTKFEVIAVTITTDDKPYLITGAIADKDGYVVSMMEDVEDGKTYYFPIGAVVQVDATSFLAQVCNVESETLSMMFNPGTSAFCTATDYTGDTGVAHFTS